MGIYDINDGLYLGYRPKLVDYFKRFVLEKLFKNRFYYVGERMVEIPFVLQNLPKGGKVLDVGCVESKLSLQLAMLGYETWGVDIRNYPFKHPNLTFRKGDIRFLQLPKNNFDCVISLSTIEHIGLQSYGNMKIDLNGDKVAIENLYKTLKKNGTFIFTFPFGKEFKIIEGFERIYDYETVKKLVDKFRVVKKRFFKINYMKTIEEVSLEEAKKIESVKFSPNKIFGSAALVLKK